MDIQRKIIELESEKAELQSQLANATGDEREVALLNAIAAKDNQLTELYKHLSSQAPAAGILSFFMISTRNHI